MKDFILFNLIFILMSCSHTSNKNNPYSVDLATPPVIYLGVPNIIEITKKGISNEEDVFDIINGSIKQIDAKNNIYELYANKVGKTEVIIYKIENKNRVKLFSKQFQVVYLPNPQPFVGNRDNTISKEMLIAYGRISSNVINLSQEIKCEITNYTFLAYINGIAKEISNTSSNFSTEQVNLIKSIKLGDYLIIKDISAVCPDSTTRLLNPMILKIE